MSHKGTNYSLPVYGDFSVADLVMFLGIDMSDVEVEATYISPLDDVIIKKDFREMQFTSSKYQNIYFRSPINDIIKVKISGAVDFPGTYSLKSDSTLSDFMSLCGGFKIKRFSMALF